MAVTAESVEAARVGVCLPLGFRTGAAAACIRGDGDPQRLDVGIIRSALPGSAAGVFTRNTVKAAPVVISQLTLRRGSPIGAVVVNSGNANACTGAQGFRDALRMCSAAGDVLDLDPSEVLVCSTGVIGRAMPMERVILGIQDAASLDDTTGDGFARAIMTTDTRPKTATATFAAEGSHYAVGGVAKGAGMIHPDLATLLVFLTTDAPVPGQLLQNALHAAVDTTFNCVTVDGDTSTNDSVMLLANGAAGGAPFADQSRALASFTDALRDVCTSLSEQIVADAEGATRSFQVIVEGAEDAAAARVAARTIAASPLVKTALHGGDPNWGRILAAAGRSGAAFTLDRARVCIADTTVFERGGPAACDLGAVRAALLQRSVSILVDLGAGPGRGHAWGCDLSADYVRINADYTT